MRWPDEFVAGKPPPLMAEGPEMMLPFGPAQIIDVSRVRSAGWGGRTDRSHDAAIAAERGERRILRQRVGHRLHEDVLHDHSLPGERVRLRVEDVRPRARAPVHIELVAWEGRAMAGQAEVLQRVHGARVRLAGRRLEEHLVETDVAPAA